jgi:hydrogenase maturation protease
MDFPRILVAGVGNLFRCDDGFGPEVARRLSALPWPPGVRVIDYGIRGLHLAYDLLEPWEVLVLVDAVPDRGAPGTVALVEITGHDPPAGAPVDAHGMDPATVLATVTSLGGRLPPRTLLVGCQVRDVGEGIGLSPEVEAAVADAVRTVRAVVAGERQTEVV